MSIKFRKQKVSVPHAEKFRLAFWIGKHVYSIVFYEKR